MDEEVQNAQGTDAPAEVDATLKHFLEAIEAASWEEVSAIAESVADDHSGRTDRIRVEAAEKADAWRRAELSNIEHEARLTVDARRAENRRSLLAMRESFADETIQAVRERVAAYAAGAEYPERLAALTRQGLEALGLQAGRATVCLRAEDMRHEAAVREAAGDVVLTFAEGEFTLGGVIIEANSRRADLSFDAALTDAKNSFAMQIG